jgi:hypothetical protein
VKTTGQIAKTASTPNTGLRALLRGPLRGRGSGMPKHLLLPVLACLITVCVSSTAVAATPEAPAASTANLPDGRAVELVSTSGSFGEPLEPQSHLGGQLNGLNRTEHLFQAAEDGEAVTYVGEPPASGGTGEIGEPQGNQWLANRTPEGWQTEAITAAPAARPEQSIGVETEYPIYQAFSADLTTGIFIGPERPLVSGLPAVCHDLYARSTGTESYQPLFTPANTNAVENAPFCGKPLFAGASRGEDDVIFQSQGALTPEANVAKELPPYHQSHISTLLGGESGEPCMFGCNLYETTVGHQPRLISIVDGKPVANATFGGYDGDQEQQQDGGPLTDFSNVISTDGSRIFWTDTESGPDMEHVYVLENDSTEVQVSGEGSSVYPAEYWTATPDGRYAYYTEGGQLYRYDTQPGPGESPRKQLTTVEHTGTGTGNVTSGEKQVTSLSITAGHFEVGKPIYGAGIEEGTRIVEINEAEHKLRLSKPPFASATEVALSSGGAEVQGVIGVNQTGEDGAYVYFVAGGALASGATPKMCGTAEQLEEEGCNLYLQHEGVTSFIANLSPLDDYIEATVGGNRKVGDWRPNLGDRTAEVTPDGRSLVFESSRSLTGYNNVAPNGVNAVEAFVYSSEDGSLACVSCTPTGAPPAYREHEENETRLPVSDNSDVYMRRWISDDGNRVFFDSEQPLVPADVNGVQDVYEWEKEGYGSCAAIVPARLNHGCVYLLTGGESPILSSLVDADATGNNAFVEHVGPLGQLLAPAGRNELYDLRVGGGFPRTSFACTGTGCQGVPPAPPLFATPASVTFAGVGDFPVPGPSRGVTPRSLTRAQKLAMALKECRAKPKRKRAACRRLAQKRYGTRATSKSKKSRTRGSK